MHRTLHKFVKRSQYPGSPSQWQLLTKHWPRQWKNFPEDINNFIKEEGPDIIDIKYSISNSIYSEEQLYCFSALIIYKEEK